jgi:hypothetical protein
MEDAKQRSEHEFAIASFLEGIAAYTDGGGRRAAHGGSGVHGLHQLEGGGHGAVGAAAQIAAYTDAVRSSTEPYLLELPNVWHLASDVTCDLRRGVEASIHPLEPGDGSGRGGGRRAAHGGSGVHGLHPPCAAVSWRTQRPPASMPAAASWAPPTPRRSSPRPWDITRYS